MNIQSEFDLYKSKKWTKKELLLEEFKSLGFYISDHPLNEYNEIFNQLKITSYKEFIQNNDNEALVAGTIMSIQEKKALKAHHLLLLNSVIIKENLSYFYFLKS